MVSNDFFGEMQRTGLTFLNKNIVQHKIGNAIGRFPIQSNGQNVKRMFRFIIVTGCQLPIEQNHQIALALESLNKHLINQKVIINANIFNATGHIPHNSPGDYEELIPSSLNQFNGFL